MSWPHPWRRQRRGRACTALPDFLGRNPEFYAYLRLDTWGGHEVATTQRVAEGLVSGHGFSRAEGKLDLRAGLLAPDRQAQRLNRLRKNGFSEPKSGENGGRSNGESITYKS